MVLKCNDCKERFDEEEASYYYDDYEVWGSCVTEKIMCCPCCKSTDIEETYSWVDDEDEDEEEEYEDEEDTAMIIEEEDDDDDDDL